jgi:hypothetical protein
MLSHSSHLICIGPLEPYSEAYKAVLLTPYFSERLLHFMVAFFKQLI